MLLLLLIEIFQKFNSSKNNFSSSKFSKTGNFPVRKKLIKLMNGCGSRSMKIFPLNEGNFIFPENKIDKTEFLYFLNVFLVVEISFIPEMFKSIISFSFEFFLLSFEFKLFFNVSKKFISFCLNIKKLFFILFNFSFFSFSFFFFEI